MIKITALIMNNIYYLVKLTESRSIMIRTKKISISYLETENPEELDNDIRELIIAAQKSAVNAYAPYSGFKVGAAVRLESGKVVCGTNVENAAFPVRNMC